MTAALWDCARCLVTVFGTAADLVEHCRTAHPGALWRVEGSADGPLVVELWPGLAETVVAA